MMTRNGVPAGDSRTAAPSGFPEEMRAFCRVFLAMWGLTALYCIAAHFLFHKSYPYDWPFFDPSVRFSDFTIYQPKFQLFHQAAFFTTGFPFTYPAPMAMFYEAFFRTFGVHALAMFVCFMVLAFATPAVMFGKALEARGMERGKALAFAMMLLLLSWPALLVFDRANVETFVWVTVAAGMWAYARGRDWLAATMFGLAAALKLFPFVLFGLLLTRRRFPKLLSGAAVFFVVTFISLAVLGPTVTEANRGIANGLQFFHDSYLVHWYRNETGLDHSVMAFFKTPIAVALHPHELHALVVLVTVYTPAMAVLGLSLYILRIRRLPRLNQVLVLTIAGIYFTPFSGDGTLLHLYAPFALCCFLAMDAARRGLKVRGLHWIFLCFGYLFAAENMLIFKDSRFEGQARCIVIGILLVLALRYPLGASTPDDEDDLSRPNATKVPGVLAA